MDTMRYLHWLLSVALLTVLLALAAACSGGDDEGVAVSQQAPNQPQAPSAAQPPTAPQVPTAPQGAAAQSSAIPVPAAAPVSAPTQAPAMMAGPQIGRVIVGLPPVQVENNIPRNTGPSFTPQFRPMYEYIVGVDPVNGALVPQLATDWALDPGTTTFRFKLREGVQFHKGWGEFTAKDVLHTFNDFTREDSEHAFARRWRANVTVEIVNDHEVLFHLNTADSEFLSNFAEQSGGGEIQSKAHFDEAGDPKNVDAQPIVSTGPYQFSERQQGQYVRYSRVPYEHWRITPDFPELEIRWLPESSTRLAALLTEEIHVAELPGDQLTEAVGRGMRVVRGPVPALRTFLQFYGTYYVDNDPAKGRLFPDSPLLDPRVRRALSKAINRDELNQAFFQGKGDIMYNNHYHPTRLGWNPAWEQRFTEEFGYDPAAARALLAEAGKSDLSITIPVVPLSGLPTNPDDVAEAVAGYFLAIGVDVKLQAFDGGTFRSKCQRVPFECDAHVKLARTSSTQLLGLSVYRDSRVSTGSGSLWNDVTPPRLREIAETLDQMQQDELYRELGDNYLSMYMEIPLFWIPAEAVVNPKFVSDWSFPGSISGTWTHMDYIKAAK